MMKKRLLFEGTGATEVFETLWFGFCVGRGMTLNIDTKQQGQSRDERRADRALMKGLESVSTPAPAGTPTLPFFGDAPRVVMPGATVVFEQAQIDKIVSYINRVPWPTSLLDASEAALDALSQAVEVPDTPQ